MEFPDGNSPEDRPKLANTQRKNALAQHAWKLSEQPAWLTAKFYSEKVQPVLAAMSSSVIARQISVSRWYVGRIREGCQTQRIPVMPVDMPTPRWDRFLREITCGDDDLAAYIQRLLTLSITGLAVHLLIFFYGRGRNGKGVLLRLLEKMIGREIFAVSLRPEDVEYHRGSEDRNKRLMGRLRGKRLA